MKIAIMAAMSKEIRLLQPLLQDMEEKEIHGLKVWTGKIGSHDIALMQCGIGKVNSALNTQRMIDWFHPELVINSGVAGGADSSMHVGDLLIAEAAAYSDVWCGPDTLYGAADGFPVLLECHPRIIAKSREILPGEGVRYGLICSSDKFITTVEEIRFIKSHFPQALACDMESASIAQTCRRENIPCNIIRVVSDTPGEAENVSQYLDFWEVAPQKTFHAVEKILSAL